MADILCKKCGHVMQDKNFYKARNGVPFDICKKCLTLHVDVTKPETYMWILKALDVVYAEEEMNVTVNKDYAKKGAENFNHAAAFGKYLAKMKLNPWNQYGFADSEKIKAEREARKQDAIKQEEQFSQDLLEQFKNGQIDEYEYKTMTTVAQQESDRDKMAIDPKITFAKDKKNGAAPSVGSETNFYDENEFIAEEDLPDPASELTQEDKVYLAMKWGRLYHADEWVALEQKYTEMMNSFDIQDADSRNTLILLCKTDLKMNQALDCGDIDGYQKLSRVSDSLRKSAKFTAAQNKDKDNEQIDCTGVLVAVCEREGGFIPNDLVDVKEDMIDVSIKDTQKYLYNLITKDLGFGQQIENYLKKIQLEHDNIEASENEEEEEITDENIAEYYERIEEEKETDSQVTQESNAYDRKEDE